MGNNKSKTVNITTAPISKDSTEIGVGKVIGIEDSDHVKQQSNSDEIIDFVNPEPVIEKDKKETLIKRIKFRSFSFGKKDKQKILIESGNTDVEVGKNNEKEKFPEIILEEENMRKIPKQNEEGFENTGSNVSFECFGNEPMTENLLHENKLEKIAKPDDDIKTDKQEDFNSKMFENVQNTELPPLPQSPPPPHVMNFVGSVINKSFDFKETSELTTQNNLDISPVHLLFTNCDTEMEGDKTNMNNSVGENVEIPITKDCLTGDGSETKKLINECTSYTASNITEGNTVIDIIKPMTDVIDELLEEASDQVSHLKNTSNEEPQVKIIDRNIQILHMENQDNFTVDTKKYDLQVTDKNIVEKINVLTNDLI
uniref:CSON011422 protein n=1 Tax=Culicoides sonorensis TaxID=179676 RepID=A0A336KIX1_CULSO